MTATVAANLTLERALDLKGGAVPATLENYPVPVGERSAKALLLVTFGILRTAMALSRCLNGIARDKLAGRPLPEGVPQDDRPANALDAMRGAVLWLRALQKRLHAEMGALPRPKPRAARAKDADAVKAAAVPWANAPVGMAQWAAAAKALRATSDAIVVTVWQMDGRSFMHAIRRVCDFMRTTAAAMGATPGQLARLEAMEQRALAVCPLPLPGQDPPAEMPEMAPALEEWVLDENGKSTGIRRAYFERFHAGLPYPELPRHKRWPAPVVPVMPEDALMQADREAGYPETECQLRACSRAAYRGFYEPPRLIPGPPLRQLTRSPFEEEEPDKPPDA